MNYAIKPALTVAQKQEAVATIKQAFYDTADYFFTEILDDPERALKMFWWKWATHKQDLADIKNRPTIDDQQPGAKPRPTFTEQLNHPKEQTPTSADQTPEEARAMDALSDIVSELSAYPDSKLHKVLSIIANVIEEGMTDDLQELLVNYFPGRLINTNSHV